MRKLKKFSALILSVVLIAGIAVMNTVSANAATSKAQTKASANQIIVHYKSTSGAPNIYYWNSLPQNIEVQYPGKAMTADSAQGSNWYTYTFDQSITKINMMFILNNVQSSEESRTTGEWWYSDGKWYGYNPDTVPAHTTPDFRTQTIYFIITTRFYDGNSGNTVHCWDDPQANNPDTDPAWHGDFQGLINKLDYIKALGFSAIWITPVVENASGYDYHGYHAFDFSKVDPRYESTGASYQDLIDAIHAKGMNLVQDIVVNHSGNFGEATLAPMFVKKYSSVKDLASISCMKQLSNSQLPSNYDSLTPALQYAARLALMKNTDGVNHDVNNYYHHTTTLSWEQPSEQTGQIAGDCVDINTENPTIGQYFSNWYGQMLKDGVDYFRLDTAKNVSRLSLNMNFFPRWKQDATQKNFFLFSEVCTRVNEVWNHNQPVDSTPFYTWAESKDWGWSNDQASNLAISCGAYWQANCSVTGQPTSQNAILSNDNTYHTPDYSKANGTGVIDYPMFWNFDSASNAFREATLNDQYFNDSTYNVVYVDCHDYGPNSNNRYSGGTDAWAENMDLMFTFRGVPCIYYGSEVEFKKGSPCDIGEQGPLSTTGRAYFGDYLDGTVTATDFSQFTASGTIANTLNAPLSKQLERLNMIRRAVPALQLGQYTTNGVTGDLAFKRRYTNASTGVDSYCLVSITNGATFSNILNGTYTDAITGDVKVVTNNTLTVPAEGKGDMRVYVLDLGGSNKISGAIGTSTAYLK
ncbi:MAG: alpha-amylase family glycosyl hydrolase [Bacillota bacterium]|nr:alpha-amylase family glycosyl hydrolase [Bacillota bacterium]